MAGYTCAASNEGITAIRKKMRDEGWTQTQVIEEVDFSRSTLNKVLSGQFVRTEYIEELCHLFDLQVEQVIAQETETSDELEQLVQRLREQVSPRIQKRCGVMRVLDMTRPINSTAIYTDVNILKRVTSKTRTDLDQLMQDADAENFDRFFLGQVKERRIPGLDALTHHRLLTILGKPGAGKTTFLKRLAMWCNAGKKGLADKVPIFIALKDFADDRKKHNQLIDFIADSYVIQDSKSDLKTLLDSGQALVLLDGLDEVQNSEDKRVLASIREFSERYDQNQIVITCRIAAREYIFEPFTEVEVADFQDEQIRDFANKWFLTHSPEKINEDGGSTIGEMFWHELNQNSPVKELATNPLLLTLLCLEFSEDYSFPSSRVELYERGSNILFTKWDGTRQIRRDQVYKKLPVARKKDLLAQLAWATFEKGNYFFKQAVAERQIQQYIQNLRGASEDEETLSLDSTAVLNSIEAQHGLLTQRAVGIYSFSHLTFQEYFSATQLANKSSLHEKLASKVYNKRYRELFLLVAEKLPDANEFVLLIRDENHKLISKSRRIQQFLVQQDHKTKLFTSNLHQSSGYRASFSYIALNSMVENWGRGSLTPILSDIKPLMSERSRKILTGEIGFQEIDQKSIIERSTKIALELTNAFSLYRRVEQHIEDALEQNAFSNHTLTEACNISGNRSFERSIDSAYTLFKGILKNLISSLSLASSMEFEEGLNSAISEVQQEVEKGRSSFIHWWQHEHIEWFKKLENSIIGGGLSQPLPLNEEDLHVLRKYYRGCRLLFDCLNSECYVDREVRQHIEDTLLIPPD